MEVEGNSPTAEGICQAHLQVIDAFDASKVEDLLEALRSALGPETPEATSEPEQENKFRGGPYLLGGLHRRAWTVKWEDLPPAMRRALDANDLDRVKAYPAKLLVQWADLLPFAIVLIRTPAGPNAHWTGHVAEGLLEALPGRLGPSDRIPRSETQLVLYAKISEERMARIRDAMQKGGRDDLLRRDLAQGLQLVGNASGTLWLESLASNVLHVEGEGSALLGDNDGPRGPFRAFVFSNGNLGPHQGWQWHLPLWIPPGLGSSSWVDFDFHPFLVGTIRNARHVGVEAGVVDEALSKASKRLPGGDGIGSAGKVDADLHGELVSLHTRLQGLGTALHLGSTRSPIGSEQQDWWPGRLRYEARDAQDWPTLRAAPATSQALQASKVKAEADTRQVLEGLERRLDRALDLVSVVETRNLNRSMRFWTIGATFLALVAILIALFAR